MDDDSLGISTSLGGSSTIVGLSAIMLSYPEETSRLIVGGTTEGGITSSVNSIGNSMESELGKDSIVMIVFSAIIGGMSAAPVIYVETKNDIEYDVIEKRANKIYDKYHKGHVSSSKKGKGIIIADTPETAVICNEMFNNTFVDEYHLVLNIESLLLAISNILDTKELISEERKQLEKAKNLLIELKAAYTEKKIITLSTKDNETLLFILNSFKKHQENKKSNAKKLIKEKKENI